MAKKTNPTPTPPPDAAKPERWLHPVTGQVEELMPPVLRVGATNHAPGHDVVDESRVEAWRALLAKKGWKPAPAPPAERSDR